MALAVDVPELVTVGGNDSWPMFVMQLPISVVESARCILGNVVRHG